MRAMYFYIERNRQFIPDLLRRIQILRHDSQNIGVVDRNSFPHIPLEGDPIQDRSIGRLGPVHCAVLFVMIVAGRASTKFRTSAIGLC